MQMEEEKRRLLEDKEKRKRDAVERASLAMQELKERKKDIDGVFMERQRQVKNKVNQKDQLIQEKNITIEEERAYKAAELRQQNEVKIKQALSKEDIIRREKLNKDLEKMSSIENQVRHFQLIKDKSETERQYKMQEHEMFRKAIIDRAKQFEKEVVTHKSETLEHKIKQSDIRVREYHSHIDNSIKKQKRDREAKLEVIDELQRQ